MNKLLENQKFIFYLKRTAATICFLAVFLYVFTSVTYLFRGSLFNTFNDDRLNIVGIKEEEQLDMVYIGGSAAYCYWIPMQAWNDFGFTSYDLGSTSIQSENILYLVKHALKYQKPELFVIGVRSFASYSSEGYEAGLRYTSDSLDLGWDRLELINTYYKRRRMHENINTVYVDIIKHHIKYDALSSPEAWKLIDNSEEHPYKGYKLLDTHYYLEEPERFEEGDKSQMHPEAEDTLYELLDFCKEEDLNVLFVVSPYVMIREEAEVYRTMDEIITSYGFRFLDLNQCYEEMELDFSRDFADSGHVNVLGAEKYTKFLGSYLVENYGLSDHRAEGDTSWNETCVWFDDMENEAKASLKDSIASAKEGDKIAEKLRGIEDLAVWSDLVKDSRFTVLAVGDGTTLAEIPYIEKKALEAAGIANIEDENYIRALCDAQILYSNENDHKTERKINIGAKENVECVLNNEERALSIMIDGEEYSRKREDGINVVVYENDYRYVADSFTIQRGADGSAELIR